MNKIFDIIPGHSRDVYMLIAVLVAELLEILKQELSATMSYLLPAIICGRSASFCRIFYFFIYQSHVFAWVASRHARNIDHMHKQPAALDVTQKVMAQPRALGRAPL